MNRLLPPSRPLVQRELLSRCISSLFVLSCLVVCLLYFVVLKERINHCIKMNKKGANCYCEVTEWHSFAIQLSFQVFQLTFNQVNGTHAVFVSNMVFLFKNKKKCNEPCSHYKNVYLNLKFTFLTKSVFKTTCTIKNTIFILNDIKSAGNYSHHCCFSVFLSVCQSFIQIVY